MLLEQISVSIHIWEPFEAAYFLIYELHIQNVVSIFLKQRSGAPCWMSSKETKVQLIVTLTP